MLRVTAGAPATAGRLCRGSQGERKRTPACTTMAKFMHHKRLMMRGKQPYLDDRSTLHRRGRLTEPWLQRERSRAQFSRLTQTPLQRLLKSMHRKPLMMRAVALFTAGWETIIIQAAAK